MGIYYNGQKITSPVQVNIVGDGSCDCTAAIAAANAYTDQEIEKLRQEQPGGGSCDCVIDQDYTPESENAQSGKAVAQAIEQAIEGLPSGGSTTETIPAYWEEHLSEKITSIKALQDEGGKDCFSFAVITDIHYPQRLARYSGKLLKRIADECDIKYVLCLGDMVDRSTYSTIEDMEQQFADIRFMLSPVADRLLRTQGNHDGSYSFVDADGDGTYDTGEVSYAFNYPPEKLHGRIFRPVGMVGDVHFDESGTGYYIDDTANKVRYIVLNTTNNKYEENEDGTAKNSNMTRFRYGQSQIDLLIEALETIKADSWGVVLASHVPPVDNADRNHDGEIDATFGETDRSVVLGIVNAYKNRTTYSGTFGTSGEYDYVSASVDFAEAKGNVLGYFAGHVHSDLNWEEEVYGIPVFTTSCDGKVENYTIEPARTAGTVAEHSFDIFTINKVTGGVYATKIGAGADRNIGWIEENKPSYTNIIDTVGYEDGRLSNSSGTIKEQGQGYVTTGMIELPVYATPRTIRTKGVDFNYKSGICNICIYNPDGTFISGNTLFGGNTVNWNGFIWSLDDEGNLELVFTGTTYSTRFKICGVGSGENLIVTIDEPIE